MKDNKTKKICEASVRVLETLKYLDKKPASVQDIIKHFEHLDNHNKIYTNEVILKYINTLKVMGYRFEKQKDKYVLLTNPNQIQLDKSCLRAFYIFAEYAETFPEERVKQNVRAFLNSVEKSFSDSTRKLAKSICPKNSVSVHVDYSSVIGLIQKCEKYCLDSQRLKITYKNKNSQNFTIMAEPNDINYRGTKVYFSVYNPLSAQIQDIDINKILHIEQLPVKANSVNICSSVTFRLKGRLAKAYKLHDEEEMFRMESDGSVIILNKREDRQILLRRLMRYGENCEVISPSDMKENMKDLIKRTLSLY